MQSLYNDGAFGIHTRSLRYGKLVTGELVTVQPSLIRRSKSHFALYPWGVEVILGLNGYIWVGMPRRELSEQDLNEIYSASVQTIDRGQREAISRTRNVIVILDRHSMSIDQESIAKLYECTLSMPASDIIRKVNPQDSLEYPPRVQRDQ